MTRTLIVTAALLVAASPRAADPTQAQDLGAARKFRVLYAGQPGTEREARFLKFLKAWFERVDNISLQKLDAASAAACDVVVADWGRRYEGGKYDGKNAPRAQLPEDFSRPIVMIGAVAGEIQRRTKINWL